MFDIEYKGGNAVVVATKKAKLIVDPKLSLIGLKDLSTKGAICLATEERFVVREPDTELVIDGPGEYEVAGFSIRGIAAQRYVDTATDDKRATIYRIEIGNVRIALLGNINSKLSEEQLEALGVVDIVIVPVGGGGYTLDGTSAAHVVRTIDAKVVIPIHFADKALKYEVPQDSQDVFIREFGGTVERTSTYKVKSASAVPLVATVLELTRS